ESPPWHFGGAGLGVQKDPRRVERGDRDPPNASPGVRGIDRELAFSLSRLEFATHVCNEGSLRETIIDPPSPSPAQGGPRTLRYRRDRGTSGSPSGRLAARPPIPT